MKKKILKKIKIKNLIALIFLLIFNTYAWFIYATKVSTNINIHVSSWDIEFASNSGEIITNFVYNVENLCPGMEKFEKTIFVNNRGDSNADLECEIESLRVLDEYYEVGDEYTSDDIFEIINNYPFKIVIEKNDELLNKETRSGYFRFTISWELDSGDDELDTLWGNKAYEYNQKNPDKPSIELKANLIASQQAPEKTE